MGRRKIEIRAIKDDRNRSVTFLKRKGGLFKKAHELSVLCSVDVAVIIFGHNKKLYEYSSGEIGEILRRYQFYGQPHEHKGPGDFKNKGGDDDDDEDDDEDLSNIGEDSLPPQHSMIPPHLQQHNSFSHMRPPQASVSPPMPNGMFQPRHSTPQPPQMGSRPSSRNMIRRSSSNLVPMHPHPTPPQPQNGFAYVPNPPVYNPQATPGLPPQPSPQPQYQQFPPPPPPSLPPPQQQQHQHQQPSQQNQQQPQTHPPHPSPQPQSHPQAQQPQHHHLHHQPPPQQQQQQPSQPQQLPPPPHQQIQQSQNQYGQDQRRLSQPPMSRHDSLQPPPQPPPHSSPQPEQQSLRPPEHSSPPQPRHISSKSRSIFTPIDEGGSVLAQHFFGAPEPSRPPVRKDISPDLRPPPRNVSAPSMPTVTRSSSQPAKPQTTAPEFPPPSRTDTSGSKSGARPKLNLQIPSEASDDDSPGGGSPQQSAGPSANPTRNSNEHIVLPPPSPSASAVLSAGASGPPNPFARPPPPTSNQNRDAYQENRNNIETPISALPSRYMNNDLLPSPSNFFSEWGDFGRNGGLNSAILPSPLTFPTPADARPPGFGRTDSDSLSEKRKGSAGEREGDQKKVKT